MNYKRLVPADSFMGRYLSYMEHQETARAYDWWCGLWALSVACGRNAYVNRPRAPVYLNLFVVLVGESGVPRKTSSVHTASSLVRGLAGGGRAIGFLDAKVTPERLDAILHARTMEHGAAQLCIAIPELAVFMGTERYVAHMPVLLTDLYDCPTERIGGGTIERGSVVQRNVWLSFLSASTPIWLLKTVNPNVVEGGFTSRCYFVVSNEPKRTIAWPEKPDTTLHQDLCDDLRIIQAEALARGPIEITSSGLATFTKWYDNRDRALDVFRQSFQAREDAHVLRVAALLCVNDGSWAIRRGHISLAIRLITSIKDTARLIFETTETRSKMAQGFDQLRSMLLSSGMDPLPRHKVFNKLRFTLHVEEFNVLLEVLHEIGCIQRFMVQGERGRKAEWLRGTQLLMAQGVGDKVLEKFM